MKRTIEERREAGIKKKEIVNEVVELLAAKELTVSDVEDVLHRVYKQVINTAVLK